jgi:membrane fusion protein, multidrug efflux system
MSMSPVQPKSETAPRLRRPILFFVAVALGLGVAFAVGFVPRLARRKALLADARQAVEHKPAVHVVRPRRANKHRELTLPGSVEAIQEVPLYARANGYLRRRLVDIGDTVKSGQLLAEIDTPELDQEIAQAEANLGQARAAIDQANATEALARATAARYEKLAGNVSSLQEIEEKRAAAAVAIANVGAAEAALRSGEANLARLRNLKGFSRMLAPFAGTITQRTTEVGALISTNQGQALFRLACTDPARVFVHVPQIDASGLSVGQQARLVVRGYAGRTFDGTITRTARAVDSATRTMLVQVEVANTDRALLPGMYGQVFLPTNSDNGALLVPASALVISAQGTQVLTVDADAQVHPRAVRVEADYGTEVALAEGVDGEQQIIADPNDRLVEGTQVVVQMAGPEPSSNGSNLANAQAPAHSAGN